MSVINATPLLAAAGGDYQISRSVRLRSSASAYFNRTPASAGNRQVMTFSWWMKLGNTAGTIFGAPATTNPRMQIYYNGPSDGRFELYQSDSGGTQVCYTLTTARYRDPSAWYHFVVAIDTTQATAANRIKWYVNGVQLTAFDTAAYPAQNTNMEWNAAAIHNIGRHPNGGSYFDGYLTEVNFIDGQALTPSSFGETDSITGVWKPKKYAGTYGTNGFYLNFSDNSSNTATTIGKDNSGNGNNWTPNNISVTAGVTYDSMIDVPTLYADGGNGRGNYCVWNPVQKSPNTVVADGNLKAVNTTAGYQSIVGSFGVTSGKWYWENTDVTCALGIALSTVNLSSTNDYVPNGGNAWVYVANGNKQNGGTNTAYGATYTSSDVIGVALDLDAGTVTFYKNGVSQGVAFSGLAANTYTPYAVLLNIQPNAVANFGQRPFTYTPPTGFKALNTQNLPEPTIVRGNRFFDVSLWTGNGTSQSIVNAGGFAPDLVWFKSRSSSALWNVLQDTVRGATRELYSNATNAEAVDAGGLTAFNSNGFSVGSSNGANQNAGTYVAWQWREGATQGFDIVTYTGDSVSGRNISHSLGVRPKMMIVKLRTGNASTLWFVYHESVSATPQNDYLLLHSTAAKASAVSVWNNTAPTSSVFTVGNDSSSNATGGTYVAYLFAEVAGFSKFGSYTGNGSADGPFVFCGFRPRFVMIKASTTAGGGWVMHDTSRSPGNLTDQRLAANTSGAEFGSDGFGIDVTSNGFKIRTSDGNWNASSIGYIFAAFAEHPFKNALAR